MKAKVLVTGVSGQVGGEILTSLAHRHSVIIGSRRQQPALRGFSQIHLDLDDPTTIQPALETTKPDIVINPAAYTQVDQAETDSSAAFRANADSVEQFAAWCAKSGKPLLHFSTDYVYQDHGVEPNTETSSLEPASVYGKSKLAGEMALRQSQCNHFIFRTSWVYGLYGQNFVKTMLRLARDKKELKIVDDQYGAPTSASTLAAVTQLVVEQLTSPNKDSEWAEEAGGTYNVCHEGFCSWYEFACEIFQAAREQGIDLSIEDVKPVSTDEFPRPAPRPKNSRMDLTRLKEKLRFFPSRWQDDVSLYIYLLGKCQGS